jgi:hypothetical protein
MSEVWNDTSEPWIMIRGGGGVVLSISSYLYNFVTTSGSEMSNHCVDYYAILGDIVGFLFVYAPNIIFSHTHIWMWMEKYLPNYKWIIGGYFKMVEWDGDRGGGAGYVINVLEKQAWPKCKSYLQLFNPNWGMKGIEYDGWFSWSKFR